MFRFRQILFLGLLCCGLLTAGIGMVPEKRRPHERLRERLTEKPELARWFMPGELGHEPGAPLGPLSDRAFLTRALGGLGGDAAKPWAEHNRLTPRLNFSHNFTRVFPPSLHDEHPEFFPLENDRRIRPPAKGPAWWQPDLGRQDVAAYAAQAAEQYFAHNPEAVSFALGVNDGLIFGESGETRALTTPVRWFRRRPDYSNLVFTFMNRAVRELDAKYSDKYLGALAYYWAENVPDFAVDPQVIPFLTADRSQGYDPVFLAEDRALQRKWVDALSAGREQQGARSEDPASLKASDFAQATTDKSQGKTVDGAEAVKRSDGEPVGSAREADNNELTAYRLPLTAGEVPLRLGLYDYIYGGGFLIPRQHPHLLAEHLRYTRRLGFTDYYAETYANWGLDGPQPWLVAQLLQDPEQSADRLLAEYYRRYFKQAARPMQKFFERCEEQWMNQPGQAYWLKFYRNERQAILFPSEVCRELRGYLDEAAQRGGSDLVRARVKQVSDAFGVTERFVAMQSLRDRLNRSVLSDSQPTGEVWTTLQAFRAARLEFLRYSQLLRIEQPLLIAPLRYEDYIKHDPTANAMVWLRQKGKWSNQLPEEIADEPELVALWQALSQPGREIIRDGQLSGAVQSPRVIADLPFTMALPADWMSTVEPAEHFDAKILGEGGDRRLRTQGNINSSFYQWNALGKAEAAFARVKIRGQVSPSCLVTLTMGWMGADEYHLGVKSIVLPAGEWPDWVELTQGCVAPAGATWVGISVHLSNQQPGDWVEIQDFSLVAK